MVTYFLILISCFVVMDSICVNILFWASVFSKSYNRKYVKRFFSAKKNLEERILHICSFKPLVWWRYTDNIFLLWQHGEEKLKEFLDLLNRYHPSIKFTSIYSRKWIDFLDVEIIKEIANRRICEIHLHPLVPSCNFLSCIPLIKIHTVQSGVAF